MDEDRLPPDLLVPSQIRRAAREGVPITVLHRGDPNSGMITLKINLLNGTAHILTQCRDDNDILGWAEPLGPDPLPDREADAYMHNQAENDPDIWTIEIEDKLGRIWFPGPMVCF